MGSPPATCGDAPGMLRCSQFGHVFDVAACSPLQEYFCNDPNLEGSSTAGPELALLDHDLKSCTPARCAWVNLEQRIQGAELPAFYTKASNSTHFGAAVALPCKPGMRARNTSARVPVLYDDATSLNVTCGMSQSACSWNLAHGCFPVQCRVWHTPNGAQQAAPASPGMYQLAGARYVDLDTVVTVQCANGYRATAPQRVTWTSSHDDSLRYSVEIANSSTAERVNASCSKLNCSCSHDGELSPMDCGGCLRIACFSSSYCRHAAPRWRARKRSYDSRMVDVLGHDTSRVIRSPDHFVALQPKLRLHLR